MEYNKRICIVTLIITLFPFCITNGQSISEKVETLLTKMTLEEKVGQMQQISIEFGEEEAFDKAWIQRVRVGGVGAFLRLFDLEMANRIQKIAVEESRLGIPLLFGEDLIHGWRTTFPIPLAEACTWDPELAQRNAAIAGKEARASGINWTYSPMVDVARDARWGRIAEGMGEDPYLSAALAAAKVRGFQGTDLSSPHSVAACVKHYVGGGAAIGGREYNNIDMSERTLREIYLPPFKAAVEAGTASIMSGFNNLNGITPSASYFLLTKILRQEWGFRGFVVTDWETVAELIIHGIAEDEAHAAEMSLLAGVDMEMTSQILYQQLPGLVREGMVPESAIDEACRRILTVKYRLGLFELPYTDPKLEKKVHLHKDHIAATRETARKSIVLLKNEGDVLPLRKDIASIALIGPLANNQRELLGTWAGAGRSEDVVTVLQGIRNNVSSQTKITYTKGCEILGEETSGFAEAVEIAKVSDIAIVVLGEEAEMSGEGSSRSSLDLPGVQKELLQAIYETETSVVVLLISGRPIAIPWTAEKIPAILEAWHLGIQAGNAIADVLFGDYNPSGKLSVTFPRDVGQAPIYYNHANTGRPRSVKYIDITKGPLFPFGYGLSYTQFVYSDLTIVPDEIAPYGKVKVRVMVKNNGDRAGEEIIQLYIRDRVASSIRPVKELKGFDKIHLEPGEEKKVTLTLGHEELGMYNQQMEFVVEPGMFDVWMGWNSEEGMHGVFEVIEK